MNDQDGSDLYDQSHYPPPEEPKSGVAKFLGIGTVPLVIAAVAVLALVVGVVYIALKGPAPVAEPATSPSTPAVSTLSEFDACSQTVAHIETALTAFQNDSATGILAAKAGFEAVSPQSSELAPLLVDPIAVLSKPSVSGSEFANAIQPVMDLCQSSINAAKQDAQDAVPVGPANTIEEGHWTVGVDVAAGTYKTESPVSGHCYWGIYKAGTNKSDIIANDNVAGGYPVVTLKKGQEFTNQGCGTFVKQ